MSAGTFWGIIHESGAFYDPAARYPHSMANRPRKFPTEAAARNAADALTRCAGRGAYYAWEMPDGYYCPLCGQHITDGKPCGCGARK